MTQPMYRSDRTGSVVPQPHHRPRVPDETLAQAIEALQEPTQPLLKVADIIQQDSLLNTLFLRYVNAAEHGFRETVVNTDRGVALLGGDRVKSFLRALKARTKAIGTSALR